MAHQVLALLLRVRLGEASPPILPTSWACAPASLVARVFGVRLNVEGLAALRKCIYCFDRPLLGWCRKCDYSNCAAVACKQT